MLTASRLRHLYLTHFSKPVGDRTLYKAMSNARVHKILEIGLGDAERAQRLIEMAHRNSGGEPVRYMAIDLFEARRGGTPGLSLKEAHRLLKATGAHVQLIPGDPLSALARTANNVQNLDLVVISSEFDEAALAGAWFYLPRMLHTTSQVYQETGDSQGTLKLLNVGEIDARSRSYRRRRAA